MKKLFVTAVTSALCLLGAAAMTACNGARDTALNALSEGGKRGFMHKTMVRGDRTRTYGLFVPASYADNRKTPIIVFLHGVGEGGNDARANLRVGLAPFVAENGSAFPFICIFPQSESGGWDANSPAGHDVITILDTVLKEYPGADADRVTLTGLSTGGYGTWSIGAANKDRFAALVPMASNGGVEQFAPELLNMPIHAFCNSGDMFGGMGMNDRGGIEKIKALGGTLAEFTETHDAGHDCWDTVYGSGDLFAWMQVQRRHGTAATPTATPVKATSSATPAHSTSGSSNASALVPTPY